MTRGLRVLPWALLGSVLIGVVAARLLVGSTGLGWPRGEYAGLVLELRVHRAGVAAIVGVALGLSGVALQALLRNPLAEPYILGLSTGAGLGMMTQGYLAIQFGLGVGMKGFGAVAGTLTTLGIVFFASRRRGVIDRLGLLLVGVVLSTINGALIMLLNYLAGPGVLRDGLAQWMMGMLQVRPWGWQDAMAACLCAGVMALLLWQGRAMDVATLDDDEAATLGVHVGRLKVLLLLSASVLTATAVLIRSQPSLLKGITMPTRIRPTIRT
ncbi:MAG: FecCD family ABC transporter permease [Phycisphaeraceae bacterium]